MSDEKNLSGVFLQNATDMAKLKSEGWYIYRSSGGGWWFRNTNNPQRMPVPAWIHELVEGARKAGANGVRQQIAEALKVQK